MILQVIFSFLSFQRIIKIAWASYQLKFKSLYFETKDKRYELSNLQKDKTDEEEVFSDEEHYRLAEILSPYYKDNEFMQNNDVPLKNDFVEVIFESIDWNDIKWGEASIKFKDRLITSNFVLLKLIPINTIDILNFKYYPNKKMDDL